MKVSRAGISLVMEFEGFYPRPYNDPADYATVGYGHLLHYSPVTDADRQKWNLTKRQAIGLLESDLDRCARAVDRLVTVPLTQSMADALASFVFNLGDGALQDSTLRRKLNAKDYRGAADEFLRWDKAVVGGKLVVLAGLSRRRKAERTMFLHETLEPAAHPPRTPAPRITVARVKAAQRAINEFSARYGHVIPELKVDGNLGPQTKAAIKRAKFLLGYLWKYCSWSEITDEFLRRLKHPSFKFSARQVARGIKRRREARKEDRGTVKGAAAVLLKRSNVYFWNGLSTGSDRKRLEELALYGKCKCPRSPVWVVVDLRILQALIEISDHGPVMVNALTGGVHGGPDGNERTNDSRHYFGKAIDVDLGTGSTSYIVSVLRKHGGVRNFETSHVHADFW